MKRKWEWSFNKYDWRWELNIGLHPPHEDDYWPGEWSFSFRFFCFVVGMYSYLDPQEL